MDPVEVRRSSRARQWKLEVPWGEPARLTVPQWTTGPEIERVLAENRAWIGDQRRRQVPRLGLERLGVRESEARMSARELVSVLADEEAARIGVAYQRIRIGGQRTVWGSCSVRGSLSFNWRLALAPFEVLDYVVARVRDERQDPVVDGRTAKRRRCRCKGRRCEHGSKRRDHGHDDKSSH